MSEDNPAVLIEKAFQALEEENNDLRAQLNEGIAQVRHMLAADDLGWNLVSGLASGDRLNGLDLDELQDVIRMMQPKIAAGSLPGRAADLHAGFVWGRGINIEGIERKSGAGRPSRLQEFARKRVNREAFLSATAQQELQKARFGEGNIIFLCDRDAGTVKRISLLEVSDVYLNPDFPEDVWAYQRTWNPNPSGKNSETVKRWYFTTRFEGALPKTLGGVAGVTEVPVDQKVRVIDGRFNRQVGFSLGIPDGLAGLHWAEAYGQHLRYGQVVTEALSRLLFKIKSETPKGAKQAAVKVAGMDGAGNTASMGAGQDVEAIRTAGNAYAFEKLRPVAAMAAAAWNVSNADLLNDSAAAGSSYGALNGLVPGNRNAMILMQREWVDLFEELFDFFGFVVPKMWFEPIEAPDVYRSAQALTILSPNLTEAESRSKALDILDIVGDPKAKGTLRQAGLVQGAKQASSPDQGVANGSGGADSGDKNDLRSDTIGESVVAMFGAQLDELREMLERVERANS